jgi:hypothetical protein
MGDHLKIIWVSALKLHGENWTLLGEKQLQRIDKITAPAGDVSRGRAAHPLIENLRQRNTLSRLS